MSNGEIVARLKRIETRLTRYMTENGFDPGVRKPEWRGDDIVVPSLNASLRSLVDIVPAEKRNDPDGFDIYVGDRFIANISLEEV